MKTPGNLLWRSISPLMILLMAVSCTEEYGPDIFPAGQDRDDILKTPVKASPPPLFADLPDGSGRSDTKGQSGTVELGSVLDLSRQRSSSFKGMSIGQIPFSDGYSGMKAYFGKKPGGVPGEASVMKRFLVVGPEGMSVVTMVTDAAYARMHPGFDYLDKPDYTGAVVFSTVSGEFLKVLAYEGGRVIGADLASTPGKGDAFIVVYQADTETKSPDGGEVTGSYAVTFRPDGEGVTWYWDPDGSPGGDGSATPEKCYSVSLSCDIPDEVEMTGGGTYTAGSTAVIGYSQRYSVKVHTLDHWTGDFAWSRSARFSRKVDADIVSTAWFEVGKPCTSSSKHVTNPLLSMRIAPSNVSMALSDADGRIYANYYGGTFGQTRMDADGNPRKHDGLDLYAEVGTPVYAAYTGTVTRAVSGYGDAPVANSYGNELRVTTGEGGKSFVVQYAHLHGGTPFAVNPRTGKPFDKDDKVFQGDLIGYTGRTGNAVDVPNPHLHFGIYTGGRWVDPKPYINGTYASGRKALDGSRGRITDVRCD